MPGSRSGGGVWPDDVPRVFVREVIDSNRLLRFRIWHRHRVHGPLLQNDSIAYYLAKSLHNISVSFKSGCQYPCGG